jgi:hypothetical protein
MKMSLSVTIIFADNTTIGAGVSLQLLSDGKPVSTATTDANGVVTFDIDPGTLTHSAIRLAPPDQVSSRN